MPIHFEDCGGKDETLFVQQEVLSRYKKIKLTRRSVSKIVDMGHTSICYYQGLVEYFTRIHPNNNICKYITFVRIRRDRYESMRSLMYQNDKFRPLNHLVYRFFPTENADKIILKVPEGNKQELINNGTYPFFWYIDEVEARWQKLLVNIKGNPWVSTAEVFWSSTHPEMGTMIMALDKVASLLNNNITRASQVPKLHQHYSRGGFSEKELKEQDKHYRYLMNYDKEQLKMLHLSDLEQ